MNTDLNLLTLTPFYPTARDDGNGCFISEPLSSLSSLGVSVSVIAAQPIYRTAEQPNSEAAKAEWVRYLSVPGGWGLASAGAFLFARIVGRVRELHRSRRIDLIHAHAPLPCGHAAMLLAAELGIPYVISVHGLDAYSKNQVSGLAGEWCCRVTRKVFRSAARVICISEHVRQQVLAGGEKLYRASVVYNGVDPLRFQPATEPSSKPSVIASVGNLIPIKGHEVLLRAVAAIASHHPDVVCEIVGNGPQRAHLEALARELGIAAKVRLLGRQSRRLLAGTLQRATLFALPSRYEGLGCVYLEAMASGKVAIGCRGQGIEEIIRHGDNGWLVGTDNVEELAAALSELLNNQMLRDLLAERGRQTVLQSLTLTHQADRLLAVYRECC